MAGGVLFDTPQSFVVVVLKHELNQSLSLRHCLTLRVLDAVGSKAYLQYCGLGYRVAVTAGGPSLVLVILLHPILTPWTLTL